MIARNQQNACNQLRDSIAGVRTDCTAALLVTDWVVIESIDCKDRLRAAPCPSRVFKQIQAADAFVFKQLCEVAQQLQHVGEARVASPV